MITALELIGAIILALIVASVTCSRAIGGRPRAHWALLGVCAAVGVWGMAVHDPGSLRWCLGALGWLCALGGFVLSIDRRHAP
jgi:hypothetical protein